MSGPLAPAAAYTLWAETYPASAHNPLMEAEERIVVRVLTHLRARRALDVGTGSGRYLETLRAIARTVVGIDLSMAMLAHAAGGARVHGDACRLPFRRRAFDVVNASLMVGDVADLRAWAVEMARVLAPQGHLVYSDFHPVWSANGWQRTFRDAAGGSHVIAFHPHTIEEHAAALEGAGLSVLAIREPRLPVAGRESPVLAIFHAVNEAATW
jgi:malonyl-CoA O-methyltransferase